MKPKELGKCLACEAGTKPVKMWAWWNEEDQTIRYVYPTETVVRMCCPGEFRRQEKEGKGKVLQVLIYPIKEE
jgi:hypothetical protein